MYQCAAGGVAGARVAGARVAGPRVAAARVAGVRVAGVRVAVARVAAARVADARVADERVVESLRRPPSAGFHLYQYQNHRCPPFAFLRPRALDRRTRQDSPVRTEDDDLIATMMVMTMRAERRGLHKLVDQYVAAVAPSVKIVAAAAAAKVAVAVAAADFEATADSVNIAAAEKVAVAAAAAADSAEKAEQEAVEPLARFAGVVDLTSVAGPVIGAPF